MIWALGWYLTLLALAALVWPLATRLFARLPDRGYSVAKPLGWLLVGYGYWILVRFGLLPNARGTILLVIVAIALVTIFAARSTVLDALRWLREQRRFVLLSEAVFLVAFAIMLLFRAFNPEIAATEKPMEFAFLNGALQSERFPPHDPWLSGQTISYYYFGYVLTAMLVKLTGVLPEIGFNLALALLFALTAQGAFGLIYNLIVAGRRQAPAVLGAGINRGAALAAGAGSFVLLVAGNLEGGLEFLHSRGFGSPAFWQSVGIENLDKPYLSATWYPTDNWFWWRATRVINTIVDGRGQDYTIAEFPFFSFLLGDLHPHVLALPFAVLAITLAFDQFRRRWPADPATAAERAATTDAPPEDGGQRQVDFSGARRLARWVAPRSIVAAIIIGSLVFLNSWDFPTYLALFGLATVAGLYLERPKVDGALVAAVARTALPVAVLGVVFFLPFYLGFQTQASGIGMVGRFGAQFHHWVLFWGVLLLPAVSLLVAALLRSGRDRLPRWWAVLIAVAPIVVWIIARAVLPAAGAEPLVTWLPGKLLLLLPMVVLALLAWWAVDRRLAVESQAGYRNGEPGAGGLAFALLMVALASTLILGAELFFVRDIFNSRMNTVFKLFYQAWILLAVVSGFSLYYCVQAFGLARSSLSRGPARVVWAGAIAAVLLVALYYPAAATANRSQGEGRGPTLDGLAFARRAEPAEVAAQTWLRRNAPGDTVVLEAVGGQYSEFARVATRTGLQTVLGWAGHEAQWRGNDLLFRGREGDVDQIYRNIDRNQSLALLRKYGVDYVYVGRLERSKYDAAALSQFDQYLPVAYQADGVTIYEVPQG